MAIYKYTLKKYFKAKSTWIIAALGFIIAGLLGGILPWSLYDSSVDLDGTSYSKLLIGSVTGMSGMLAIFTSIFAGYKSATMYKDEVEDGTFLVILSKPQSRFKIIITKWFALQTVTIIFLLFLVTSYGFINMMNDSFPQSAPESINSFTSQAWKIMGAMFGVIFVSSLIFSSLGLLISTRTSTSAAIAISTSIGVIIPITGLLQTFTQGSEYAQVTNGSFELTHATNTAIFGDNVQSEKLDALYENLTHQDYGLLNMGFKTGKADTYKGWSFIDINYQIGKLSSYASETVITPEFRDIVSAAQTNAAGGSPFSDNSKAVVAKNNVIGELSSDSSKTDEAKAHTEKMVYGTLQAADEYAQELYALLTYLSHVVNLNDGNDITDVVNSEYDDDIKINLEVKESSNPVDPLFPFELNEDNPRYTTLSAIKQIYGGLKVIADDYTLDSGKMLSSILDEEYVAEFAKNMKVNNAPEADIVLNDPDGNDAPIILVADTADHKIYAYIENLAVAGKGYLNMVEKTPYITKEAILLTYLLIAFGLVPLSILIVKKQDFR